jgi:capsular exopolysaccharide synthesis family protein
VGSRLSASTQPSCLGAEKFRLLALQLRHVQQRRRLKKLLVTSTVPQEGKSFVSANLAVTLARQGEQKILLLDGDLRRPVLNTNLGLGNHPGLHEWLRRDVPLWNAIHQIEDLGFWFLPAGDPANSPAEGMQSARLVDTLDELSLLFDWIIIDSPPLVPLTDASVWCRVVDGVLFVTREGTTKRRELRRGIEMLDKSSIVGVVINECHSADQDNHYGHYLRQLKTPEGEIATVHA